MKNLRKRVAAVAMAAVMSVSALAAVPSVDAQAAGKVTKVAVTNLRVSSTKNGCDYYCKTLKKGKTFTIKSKVSGTTSNKKVTYKVISGSKYVKVSKSGKVTAKKTGTAVVKVMSKTNSKKFCKVKVTVGTPAKTMKVSKTKASVSAGKTVSITARITNKASNKNILFVSSNKKVANVVSAKVSNRKTGQRKVTIKGLAAGTATIKAIAADGSGVYKKIKITVVDKTVTISGSTKTLNPPKSIGTVKSWKSNSKYVTVSSKGKVTVKQSSFSGTKTVTVTATGTKGTYTYQLTVNGTKKTEAPTTEHQHDWVVQYDYRTTTIKEAWDEQHYYCSACGICELDAPEGGSHITYCGEYYYDEVSGQWEYAGAHWVGKTTYHDAEYETQKVLVGYVCSTCGAMKSCDEKVVETNHHGGDVPIREITMSETDVNISIDDTRGDGSTVIAVPITVKRNSDVDTVWDMLATSSDRELVTVRWGSDAFANSDTRVLELYASGYKTGTATITLAAQDGSGVTATVTVTVTGTVDEHSPYYSGKTGDLKLTVSSYDMTYGNISAGCKVYMAPTTGNYVNIDSEGNATLSQTPMLIDVLAGDTGITIKGLPACEYDIWVPKCDENDTTIAVEGETHKLTVSYVNYYDNIWGTMTIAEGVNEAKIYNTYSGE